MFSTFDPASGFWQISRYPKNTAVITHGGFYRIMPFSLMNAPATFQRAIELILDGYPVFIDDDIVASHGAEEHLQKIQVLFDVIRANHIKLCRKKYVFFRIKSHFLSHVISKDGINVDMKEIQAVKGFPVPTSVKNIQQFLGLASYYRHFVKGFSQVAKSMHLLLKKGTAFDLTGECQTAFDRLKTALTEAPCLIYPDFSLSFILCADASCDGLGAVIEQIPDGSKHPQPVHYARVSHNKTQKNYSTAERECLAVVWATGKFRHYLMVQEFLLITDHIAL